MKKRCIDMEKKDRYEQARERLSKLSNSDLSCMYNVTREVHDLYLDKKVPEDCPFCCVYRHTFREHLCPWTFLEGIKVYPALPCIAWLHVQAYDYTGFGSLYLSSPRGLNKTALATVKKIRRKRLTMLNKWEKLLKDEISKRSDLGLDKDGYGSVCYIK